MRVVVDGRSLTTGRGVARFVRSVLDALAPAAPDVELVAVVPGRAPLAGAPAGVRLVRTALPSQAVFGAAALTGRPRLDRLAGGADVVWVPAPAPVAVSAGVPVVLTVHDRAWEHRPADYTRYERLFHRLARPRATAARAAAVTAVSAAVRDDVAAAWSLDPARLHVVHPGPGLPRAPAGVRAGGPAPAPARPYLLAVGALEPRKAPAVLAEAYRRAVAGGLDADLVVVGSGRLEGVLRDVPGIRLAGAVADPELDALYAGALALVHPALMEGFGLPPLEAALRGVPTAGSDLPPLRETLGDAALLVPPGDAGALAAALVRLGADPALRDRLGAAAGGRAAGFTWERTAAGLLAVLREAAR